MERMDSTQRASATAVIKRLFTYPYDFSFLQAVRLFQKLLPGGERIGDTLNPFDDPISFTSRYTYSLPSSDIYHVYVQNNKPVIEVNFWNLAGPHGPLPNPLSEKVIERAREGDYSLRDFIDIFNHRLLSVYYRIAQKYSFVLSPEDSIHTPVGHILYAVSGIDPNQGRDLSVPNLSVPTMSVLQYAGILWQRPRSAAGLEQILSDHFQVSIEIEQFVGGWVNINRRQRSFIGKRKGRNHKLGKSTFLGKRFWQSNHHFIVKVGPLTSEQFHRFVPTGHAYMEMCDIIRFYAPLHLTFQLKISLKNEESLVAAGFENSPKENRLGWTAVLGYTPRDYRVTINAA